jgi:hypothetical protein
MSRQRRNFAAFVLRNPPEQPARECDKRGIGELERDEEHRRGNCSFGVKFVDRCFAGAFGSRHNTDVRKEHRHPGKP